MRKNVVELHENILKLIKHNILDDTFKEFAEDRYKNYDSISDLNLLIEMKFTYEDINDVSEDN